MLLYHGLVPTRASHPHTPAPPVYGQPSPSPTPHYGALGYRAPSYGYTPRPPQYAPPRPHYPTSPVPGYGAQPHAHAKPHGSEYGPPVCVKNATLHTYCLEDYEYPSYEIQVGCWAYLVYQHYQHCSHTKLHS